MKTIVITGGSSGVGAAAASALARMGAQVIITGRSAATGRIASALGCDHFLVDYARFSDVRRFAGELIAKYPRIDVLVNNVGGVFAERRVTEDGHEMTLQVNHLSGFLLTSLVTERLQQSHAVVINTSSAAHLVGRLDFADLENARRYRGFRAYGTAKLMNILHAMEIARRFEGVSAASFHPGVVRTGFARAGSALTRFFYSSPLTRAFLISPERGADTLEWLVTNQPGKAWQSGEFYYKRKPGRKSAHVTDANARELWTASERLIGI